MYIGALAADSTHTHTHTHTSYSGERKATPITKAISDAMPQFVARITEPAFATWQRKPGAKVLLFSKKREPPPQLRALSTKYRDRNVSFGLVDHGDAALRGLFGVNEFPTLVAIEAGKRVGEEGYTPAVHKGGTSFVSMDFFVMDFAAPESSSSSNLAGDDTGSGGSGTAPTPSKSRAGKSPPTSRRKKGSTTASDSKTKKKTSKSSAPRALKKTLGNTRRLPQPSEYIKLKGTDLTKLTVKQLRGVLARWDDPCTSCLEKSNFIERIEKHRSV